MKRSIIPWSATVSSHPLVAWQDSINDMFENFFDAWPQRQGDNLKSLKGSFAPSLNLEDTPEALLVSVEVPGLRDEDLDVSIADQQLIIAGHKREDFNREENGVKYLGRSYGEFKRVIQLDFEPDEGKLEAKLEQGVLRLQIPKSTPQKPKSIKLNVKSA